MRREATVCETRPVTAPRRTRARTLWADFRARAVEPVALRDRGSGWPVTKWQRDPCGFAREVLGLFLMPHQGGILESIRDRPKTAVRSGQKTGKTKSLDAAALWCYGSFPGGRVVMTANTKEQVRNVLWRELRETIRHAPVAIPGKWSDNPATGFRADDGREIIAVTTREIESLGGISGGAQLFLVDEASALTQAKAEALEGNMAGAGWQRMAWYCNPTRSEGPMFEAFHSQKDHFARYHVDSEVVARWHSENRAAIAAWQRARGLEATGQIPGVVTLSKVESWADEYGTASPFYTVRVKGNFLMHEGGKPISLHMIQMAQLALEGAEEDGPLSLGIDPAGPGDGGDDIGFALTRGHRMLLLQRPTGLTEDAIIDLALAILKTHRRVDERPRIVVDAEGPIGSALFYRLRGIANSVEALPSKAFTVHAVRASRKATRQPDLYDRTREELVANLATWLNEGGGIIGDHKLAQEMHAYDWKGMPGKGILKLAQSKVEIKAKLGRSPDALDALSLSVWPMASYASAIEEQARAQRDEARKPAAEYAGGYARGEAFDAYGSNEWWRPEA